MQENKRDKTEHKNWHKVCDRGGGARDRLGKVGAPGKQKANNAGPKKEALQ